MRTYDVHYLDDLASLEYGMPPYDFLEMVNERITFFRFRRSPIDEKHGNLGVRVFENKAYYIPKLTDRGLEVLRSKLSEEGVYPLHELNLSFTEMVNMYNTLNPACVRDIGERWNYLNSIEDKKDRFLKYREIAEVVLNNEDNFKVNEEYYKYFL